MKVNARSRPIPWVSQTKDGQVLLSVSREMFVVGALIIIFGVGVFGTSTGFLAYAFLSSSEDRDETPNPEGADKTSAAGALEPATGAESG